jgi:CRISPR-associated protein Cas5h
MIASMLGKERDIYYESFSTNYCKVGLQIKKPVRRVVQTVNYLNTDRIALSTWELVTRLR